MDVRRSWSGPRERNSAVGDERQRWRYPEQAPRLESLARVRPRIPTSWPPPSPSTGTRWPALLQGVYCDGQARAVAVLLRGLEGWGTPWPEIMGGQYSAQGTAESTRQARPGCQVNLGEPYVWWRVRTSAICVKPSPRETGSPKRDAALQ